MTGQRNRRNSLLGRLFHSWQAPTLAGVVVLLLMIYWLAPRRTQRVIPVDNSTSWETSEAPPRREILWQPATEIPALFVGESEQVELVTPRLTNGGTVLYFSRRVDETHADIYRSQLIDGEWQRAEPVNDLNTSANELGPVLSPDGRQLYFYSDRPGGLGGTDIYTAQRKDDGSWDKPRNLGPKVNTRAYEYDPAISSDGLSLYFASNRTDETARLAKGKKTGAAKEWTVTLRAQLDLTVFDLYRATRESTASGWNASAGLDSLNRPDSTEGAPFISPNGAFIYFASDRPVRPGERRNLDLYRARLIGDEFTEPENLGPSINTEAHETEPGLSPEGFTLLFSSNRDGNDRLYASTAEEVYYETEWDTSRLSSLGVPGWWWLPVTMLILATFLLGLFYFRGWLMQRVWPARFFLGSVMVNLLILLLLAMWTLPEVFDVIVDKVAEILPAPQIFGEDEPESSEDGRESYEKTADLKSVDPVPLPKIARRETDALSVPAPKDGPAPTIPIEVARALPQNRVMFVPRNEERVETMNEPEPLVRRRARLPERMLELPEPPEEQLAAVDLPKDRAIARVDVDFNRTQNKPARPDTTLPKPPDNNPLTRLRPAVRNVRPLQSVLPPSDNNPAPPPLERNMQPKERSAVGSVDDAQTPPSAEDIPAEQALAAVTTKLDRSPAALVNQNATPTKLRQLPAVDAPLRPMTKPQPITLEAPDSPDDATGVEPLPAEFVKSRRPVPTSGVTVTSLESPADVKAAAIPKLRAINQAKLDLRRNSPASPKAGFGPRADLLKKSVAAEAKPPELAAATPNSSLPNIQPADEPASVNPLARAPRRSTPNTRSAEPIAEDLPSPSVAETKINPGPIFVKKAAPPNLEPARIRVLDDSPGDRAPARKTTDRLALARLPEENDAQPPTSVKLPVSLNRFAVRTAADFRLAKTEQGEEIPLADAETPAESELAAAEVPLARLTNLKLDVKLDRPQELTGPNRRIGHRVVVGELSNIRNDEPPAFSPLANRLNRRRAHTKRVAAAKTSAGLQSLFMLRQVETRKKYIDLLGGTKASEKAVNLGLEWLAKNQEEDGSWDLKKHNGSEKSNTAGTGFGLLPFLAAGYTHQKPGQYQKNVAAAVRWLLDNQKENGDLLAKGDGQHMYSHGIAAIALCEAYGMSEQDPELEGPARKALEFIVGAQHKGSGGWRYKPNESADTSVVGWQMMALKSGEMAGLTVPDQVYQNVDRWLKKVEGTKKRMGTFGYTSRSPSPAMTAEGLLSLQFMGLDRNSPRMRSGADFLLNYLPQSSQKHTSYYWYYGTQVMYHMQGKYWDTWNERLRDMLVETQITKGEHAGSWQPRDQWETRGGRVYATSLKLLMLEVYYRHLPLYEQLED